MEDNAGELTIAYFPSTEPCDCCEEPCAAGWEINYNYSVNDDEDTMFAGGDGESLYLAFSAMMKDMEGEDEHRSVSVQDETR
jgi:hypothetical protein